MQVIDIIIDWLKKNGYDGLYESGECACKIEDLAPCDSDNCLSCEPGYLSIDENGEFDFMIGPSKLESTPPKPLDDDCHADEVLAMFRDLMPTGDPTEIVDLLREHWRWDGEVRHNGDMLELYTASWPGNEDIVCALHKSMFWVFCWEESHRGGYYKFDLSYMMRRNDKRATATTQC